MKRKEGDNILSREKNVQFKSLKQSRDSSLGICQHCGFNENNVMRRGPDGRKNLCNACGLFWTRKGKLRDLSKGRKNHSVDQSDLDPLVDVNITVLEGELPVIQNEQVAAITSAKLGYCSRDILYLRKRKEGNNILSREKNVQFKSLQQSRDSSLRICQHCGFNENNVMRRGPDGRKNLCNACGLIWMRKGKLRDLSKGRKNRSIDQSDMDPLIDVNITALEGELSVIQNEQVQDPLIDVNVTVLEGELPVIQNEQGISEDPSKAIATEGSNNHALYPSDEELPESLEHLTNTLGIDHSSENDDEQPMKSFTFSETLATIESLLAFLDKEVPST